MATAGLQGQGRTSTIERLNGVWHKPALVGFAVITLAHWAEHLIQAAQVWLFDRARPEARGALGSWFPWLVSSEWLHYLYAVIMLVGLTALLPGFVGQARAWWKAALVIQLWHHVEHALLLYQAQANSNLFGEPVPTSVVQLAIPRVELHLFYNAVVTIPMVVAMYLHSRSSSDALPARCTCSRLGAAVVAS